MKLAAVIFAVAISVPMLIVGKYCSQCKIARWSQAYRNFHRIGFVDRISMNCNTCQRKVVVTRTSSGIELKAASFKGLRLHHLLGDIFKVTLNH